MSRKCKTGKNRWLVLLTLETSGLCYHTYWVAEQGGLRKKIQASVLLVCEDWASHNATRHPKPIMVCTGWPDVVAVNHRGFDLDLLAIP